MKRLVLFLLMAGVAAALFAQVQLPEYHFAAGEWKFVGARLYQNDARARLAKVNLRAPQSGPMIYDFNVRYEDGLQDGQGGFGLHIFADSAYNAASWGAGRSYLLWLNYDEKPVTRGIPAGFSAQIYRSTSNSAMDLVDSIDLNEFLPIVPPYLSRTVPVRIWVNGNTGEVRVYDPTDPQLEYYYYFYIDRKSLPLRGSWVALRTNGVKLSFGMGI
jgi:hypothetical protein